MAVSQRTTMLEHGAVVHDITGDLDWADDVPTCCAEGSDCGRNAAVRIA